MLHKADGPVLFDLRGFCSRSIRVFSGSLRIGCMAYFCDSVLSAVSGFAPRIVCRSLPDNPSACCQEGLAHVPKKLPVCCLSLKGLKKKKKKGIMNPSSNHLRFQVARLLFTSDCQQCRIKLVPVPRNKLNCFDICSDCSCWCWYEPAEVRFISSSG